MRRPATVTVPVVGRNAPPIMRSSVVLPHPERPMIATIRPRGTDKLMPFNTGRTSYAKLTSLISTRFSIKAGRGDQKGVNFKPPIGPQQRWVDPHRGSGLREY